MHSLFKNEPYNSSVLYRGAWVLYWTFMFIWFRMETYTWFATYTTEKEFLCDYFLYLRQKPSHIQCLHTAGLGHKCSCLHGCSSIEKHFFNRAGAAESQLITIKCFPKITYLTYFCPLKSMITLAYMWGNFLELVWTLLSPNKEKVIFYSIY